MSLFMFRYFSIFNQTSKNFLGPLYTSSASKTESKITKILRFFDFLLEFESFKFVKYCWCYEFSKRGTFSWLTLCRKPLLQTSYKQQS